VEPERGIRGDEGPSGTSDLAHSRVCTERRDGNIRPDLEEDQNPWKEREKHEAATRHVDPGLAGGAKP